MRDCHIRQCKKPYQSGAFTNLKQMPFGFIHSRMNKKNDFLKKKYAFRLGRFELYFPLNNILTVRNVMEILVEHIRKLKKKA